LPHHGNQAHHAERHDELEAAFVTVRFTLCRGGGRGEDAGQVGVQVPNLGIAALGADATSEDCDEGSGTAFPPAQPIAVLPARPPETTPRVARSEASSSGSRTPALDT
jgi:hypothetical protein